MPSLVEKCFALAAKLHIYHRLEEPPPLVMKHTFFLIIFTLSTVVISCQKKTEATADLKNVLDFNDLK
jgi:hypothetical protein